MKDYPLNSIKGKICTHTYIEEFDDAFSNIDFNIQPKMIIFALSLFLILINITCTISALRNGFNGNSDSKISVVITWVSHSISQTVTYLSFFCLTEIDNQLRLTIVDLINNQLKSTINSNWQLTYINTIWFDK